MCSQHCVVCENSWVAIVLLCGRVFSSYSRDSDDDVKKIWHHRTTLSGYIFAAKACIGNRKKLVKHRYLLHVLIIWWTYWRLRSVGELGHPCKFQRVLRLGSVTAWHCSNGHQPNIAALNRGRHQYSAGWPSRWAMAHILVFIRFFALPSKHPKHPTSSSLAKSSTTGTTCYTNTCHLRHQPHRTTTCDPGYTIDNAWPSWSSHRLQLLHPPPV